MIGLVSVFIDSYGIIPKRNEVCYPKFTRYRMKIMIGTYTKRISQGIYRIELDPVQRKLHDCRLAMQVSTPTYLAFEAGKTFSVAFDTKGGVVFFRDQYEVDRHFDEAVAPCYVSLHPDRSTLFTANYHGGHADVYSIINNTIEPKQRFRYPAGSHAHSIAYVPMFDEVIVCDLGLDNIHAYKFENGMYVAKYVFDVPKGKGPRHFAAHPKLPILYVVTELSSEVLVLTHENEALTLIQTIATLPEREDAIKWASAIRISSDGKFLYTAQRGHDSISVFRIDEKGRLERIQTISSFGKHPRDFALSPDNRFLVCANLDTDNLTLYARNEATGLLEAIQKDVFCPEPVCVVFQENG